jgi:hypothetical protein
MNTVLDIIKIAISGLHKLSIKDFYITIIGALVFSALVGFACHFFYRLWNKSYRTTLTHKIMTMFSSILSFLFIICFVGFTFLEEVAMSNILIWKESLRSDEQYNNQAFQKAFQNVKGLGIENFNDVPNPGELGSRIPVTKPESQLEAGKTYYEEAVINFKKSHSFLNAILSVKSENTPETIQKDMEQYFSEGNNSYSSEKGIEIVANDLKESLFEQAPKVVKVSRILLILLFLLAQMIPFGPISYSAYKDLKIQS